MEAILQLRLLLPEDVNWMARFAMEESIWSFTVSRAYKVLPQPFPYPKFWSLYREYMLGFITVQLSVLRWSHYRLLSPRRAYLPSRS